MISNELLEVARKLTLIMLLMSDFSFFFQAEDGIRDTSVTGVQTCALPICPMIPEASRHVWIIGCMVGRVWYCAARLLTILAQIGRASCRERV